MFIIRRAVSITASSMFILFLLLLDLPVEKSLKVLHLFLIEVAYRKSAHRNRANPSRATLLLSASIIVSSRQQGQYF